MSSLSTFTLRHTVQPDDTRNVREIVESTGMFRPDEVDVAVELVDERLAKGEPSGYYFLFAEIHGHVVGYACYGPIACTVASFDLFWIAVRRDCQTQGLGRKMLDECERLIQRAGGTRIYIDTSGRAQYLPTRRFYERCGYTTEATLTDFYAPGDDRVIFSKALPPNPASHARPR